MHNEKLLRFLGEWALVIVLGWWVALYLFGGK
jgi:hypothetical protein